MTTVAQKEARQIEALNKALEAVDTIAPLVVPADVGDAVNARMLEGLAQAYSIPGFREFLSYFVNRQMKLTAMKSTTLVDQAAGKARTLIVKEILSKGRQAYLERSKIQELTRGKQ